MEKTYEVIGMKCQGCVKTVTEKLSAVRGVEKVVVDWDKKQKTKKNRLSVLFFCVKKDKLV